MRTSPTVASSASKPGSFMKLILSTRAGGNVVSIPKMTPIFFTTAPLTTTQRPRRLRCKNSVEAPWESARQAPNNNYHFMGKTPHSLTKPSFTSTSAPSAATTASHDSSGRPTHAVRAGFPAPAELPQTSHSGPSTYRVHPSPAPCECGCTSSHRYNSRDIPTDIEINILARPAIHETPDVERSAHADARVHQLRIPEREVDRMVCAEAASRDRGVGCPVPVPHQREHIVDDVALILQMSLQPPIRMRPRVVPALFVHAVHAINLQLAVVQLVPHRGDHLVVFVLEEAPA